MLRKRSGMNSDRGGLCGALRGLSSAAPHVFCFVFFSLLFSSSSSFCPQAFFFRLRQKTPTKHSHDAFNNITGTSDVKKKARNKFF